MTSRVRSRLLAVHVLWAATLLWTPPAGATETDWPTWRGPGGLGVSNETGLPDRWNVETDTVWKATIPGTSTSTPVVWGDRVFLTTQLGQSPIGRGGEAAPANSRVTFLVLALDRLTGRELWRREIPATAGLPATHMKHNLASPSPVTDGRRVVAWFSTGQVAAFDLAGNELWQRNLAADYGPFEIRWAHGSSPVLYKDQVILLCEHTSAYLIALDARTGINVWKADRQSPGRSYTTPLLLDRGNRTELVINAAQRIEVVDPTNGSLLWSVGQPIQTPVSTPVYADGVLYTSRGYRSGPYMAVRLDQTQGDATQGDVTDTHTLWRVATGAPYVSSLLHYKGLVFMATETGVVSAIDGATGATVWKERLGGNFSASPVAGDGKIYLANEEGEFFVLAASRTFRVISQTSLDESIQASPVISGGRILLRSESHLYSF